MRVRNGANADVGSQPETDIGVIGDKQTFRMPAKGGLRKLKERACLVTLASMTPVELPPIISEAIMHLSADGDALAAAGSYEEAIAEYNRAWEVVPEPKTQWNASTWILAAIADAAFLAGYKTSAREALEYAMLCPNALGNPFLHLRLGQVLFDAGEHDRAADELMRAYMGAGSEIFASEDDRYFAFLRTRAALD